MVSKNNLKYKMEENAQRTPHYGLRKLSVGVASVLLSTTLYFGVTANASTDVADSGMAPETNENQVNETSDRQKISQTVVNLTDSNTTATQNDSLTDTNSFQSGKQITTQLSSTINQNASTDNFPAITEFEENSSSNGVEIPENQDESANQALIGTSDSLTLSDGSTLSTNDNVLNSNNPSTVLTFKTSSAKNGDVYTITIPTEGLISNNSSSTDVPSLDSTIGNTDVSTVGNFLVIKDTFTTDVQSTVTQDIVLHYVFNSNIINGSFEKFINDITIQKNSEEPDTIKIVAIGQQAAAHIETNSVDGKSAVNNTSLPLGLNFWFNAPNGSMQTPDQNAIKNANLSIELPTYFVPQSVTVQANDGKNSFTRTISASDVTNGILSLDFGSADLAQLQLNNGTYQVTLNGEMNVPDTQFSNHSYVTDDPQATVTITDANDATFAATKDFGKLTVIDSLDNVPTSGIIAYNQNYVA